MRIRSLLEQAGLADRLVDLRTLLDRLSKQDEPPRDEELRHLRSLLISAAPAAAEAVRLLDAVLDSPLDVDSSALELLKSRLEPGASPCPSRTEDLVSQLQTTTRALQQQAERMQQGRAAFERQLAHSRPRSAEAASTARLPVPPASPAETSIRGLHVRQGGHDFVLPIQIVERALAVDVARLPTVCGRPVACVSGEMCDVVHLADKLGLSNRCNSSPGTLIVISLSGRRVSLAIDEVVGPVKATVTPLNRVLPDVTAAVDVASLESGALALVPDFSRLIC